MNDNLISVSRRMQHMLQELDKFNVTVLSAWIGRSHSTPKTGTPPPFQYDIHVWHDENFVHWARHYYARTNEYETTVQFTTGQVYALHD